MTKRLNTPRGRPTLPIPPTFAKTAVGKRNVALAELYGVSICTIIRWKQVHGIATEKYLPRHNVPHSKKSRQLISQKVIESWVKRRANLKAIEDEHSIYCSLHD